MLLIFFNYFLIDVVVHDDGEIKWEFSVNNSDGVRSNGVTR